jgi:PadR family transcriptional regulator
VLQGTLDIMVLQTLAVLRPSQVSGGRVQLNMGTLYPGLMRLEQRGSVRGTWGVTETSRSRTPPARRDCRAAASSK